MPKRIQAAIGESGPKTYLTFLLPIGSAQKVVFSELMVQQGLAQINSPKKSIQIHRINSES